MSRKKKLVHLVFIVIGVVAVTEFQKVMKRRAEPCVGGICKIPSEKAGAIVGPQSVPILPSRTKGVRKPLPELINFESKDNAPCMMMNVILTELSGETADSLRVRIFDVDESEARSREYAIRTVPTQIFLDAEGHELARHEGYMSKEDILKKWAELGVAVPGSSPAP